MKVPDAAFTDLGKRVKGDAGARAGGTKVVGYANEMGLRPRTLYRRLDLRDRPRLTMTRRARCWEQPELFVEDVRATFKSPR